MLKKFNEKTLIVGLGYVGLTLALALANKADVQPTIRRVVSLNRSKNGGQYLYH